MGAGRDVRIVHFADPWCWWSWGLEPVLQRIREVYGDRVRIEYRMGGMAERIPDWMEAYGVDEKTTVDWVRESVEMTGNPVDLEYIRKTGVTSSHPSCEAFKAAERQDPHLAERFFRRMMEAFQIEAQRPTDEEFARLAKQVGLDGARLVEDMRSPEVRRAFEDDMAAMQKAQVNFLSLVVEAGGKRAAKSQVFTAGPYEEAIDGMVPDLPKRIPSDILDYVEGMEGHLVSTREVAEVFRVSEREAADRLERLQFRGFLASRAFAKVTFWTATSLTSEKLPLDIVRISHVTPEAYEGGAVDLTPIITKAVQNLYSEIAEHPEKEYHFPLGHTAARFVGYPEEDLRRLPPRAVESFAGVGYPFAAGAVRPGDTVLDIGSGSGTDVLYASLKVGPRGKVWGLDFTQPMIGKARSNVAASGAKNVEILEGNAARIPLPDASVDVVTSNGVLNLVPDKAAAFREIHRVLKPGGRLQLADIVVQEDVGAVCGINPQLWADCIGGAAVEAEYLRAIRDAGFSEPRIVRRLDYFSRSRSDSTKRITKTFGAESVVLVATRNS